MKTVSSTIIASTIALASLLAAGIVQADKPAPLAVADYFRIQDVSDPQISPDGLWVAYQAKRHDLDKDKSLTQIWMVATGGGEAVPLTARDESSSRPRWSPDGKYLAFLSARNEGKTQVWRLYRQGGEAIQVSDTAQDVDSFEWSPDGRKLVLVLRDPSAQELEAKEQGEKYEKKIAPPWVITRRQFKMDYQGYLDERRTHLHVLDIESGDLAQLTEGAYDDTEPSWSPDGQAIAFVSNRTPDPDANYNTDIWVVSARPGESMSAPRQVTTNPGADSAPAWSPDGKHIAHISVTDVSAMEYATRHLAVSAVDRHDFAVLTAALDRNVLLPRFARDGKRIAFVLEDNGRRSLVSIGAGGGAVDEIIGGDRVIEAYDQGPSGRLAALISEPQLPAEVFTLTTDGLEQLSQVNTEVLATIDLGTVLATQFASRDGTQIHGFAVRPPGFRAGRRYPTVLALHGGPQAQYEYAFSFEGQLLAAGGYLVLQPNPRGSTGFGQDFCIAIWQGWGEKDYEDVIAAVDDAIARGWSDPERLAVEGWSYGGMLTNHVITKTTRFKAAITGASAALYVVNYGHDQYQRWWDQEIGAPWRPESRAIWERMSPFNQVENITTPTLIVGGEEDWNVPIINSEQLYLALRQLGRETELVVYPGEYHGIDTPSHAGDLYQRYLDWLGKFLGG